jgi:hypothetical protein
MLVTPDEILRYLNPDGLRQLLRQERLRWNLKPNRDSDYYSNSTLFRYSGDLHNEGDHQRMEVRAFSDNGANPGYAGVYTDGGEFGLVHGAEHWDDAVSEASKNSVTPRVQIGAQTVHQKGGPIAEPKTGFGLNPETNQIEADSPNREASHVYDAHDGRAYILSNDENVYVNNKTRKDPLPGRTDARICDIPTELSDLNNPDGMVADWDYQHTDNNFTNSHRFVLDNVDDRTFVYPEIAKGKSGEYVLNRYTSLAGGYGYDEGDGTEKKNAEDGERYGEERSSFNANKAWQPGNPYAGEPGYFPGVFRSLEELQSVDLLNQRRTVLTHSLTPAGRRRQNFYQFDGLWENDVYDTSGKPLRHEDPNQVPTNMEGTTPGDQPPILDKGKQPHPYHALDQDSGGLSKRYHTTELFQWRYNRISIHYYLRNIKIHIADPGTAYKVGDVLRYHFMSNWIFYRVHHVGPEGEIIMGEIILHNDSRHPDKGHAVKLFQHDPSTNGVQISFRNQTGGGYGSKFVIECPPSIESFASQLKNNLYAYVDVVPTVASDNDSDWSDTKVNDKNDVRWENRSTAPAPGHTGVNRGRGCESPDPRSVDTPLVEHSGNATAGPHVHLFKYVIDTSGDWANVVTTADGVDVYTGRWVDQGPMGLERPCDIKALLLSNQDTNNFNNYYKFMMDIMIDAYNRIGDKWFTGNTSSFANMYVHIADELDPWEQRPTEISVRGPSQDRYERLQYDFGPANVICHNPTQSNGILKHQAFFSRKVDPKTGNVTVFEVTDRVLYHNAKTTSLFMYNPYSKPSKPIGWYKLIDGALLESYLARILALEARCVELEDRTTWGVL